MIVGTLLYVILVIIAIVIISATNCYDPPIYGRPGTGTFVGSRLSAMCVWLGGSFFQWRRIPQPIILLSERPFLTFGLAW